MDEVYVAALLFNGHLRLHGLDLAAAWLFSFADALCDRG